jgi:hypothetical protein
MVPTLLVARFQEGTQKWQTPMFGAHKAMLQGRTHRDGYTSSNSPGEHSRGKSPGSAPKNVVPVDYHPQDSEYCEQIPNSQWYVYC